MTLLYFVGMKLNNFNLNLLEIVMIENFFRSILSFRGILVGMDMAQLICGGCRTLLMYAHGATSVRCSCCHTVNIAPVHGQVANMNCGNCRTMLMYPYGAPSVKCALCHYVTNVNMTNATVPRANGADGAIPCTSAPIANAQTQTVVVENPMTVDQSGKLVSNVVVGVSTGKKQV